MPGSFSQLAALSGISPWETIRQEKGADLQRVILQSQFAQKKLAEEEQAAQLIQEHLNQANNLQVLAPDHAKIVNKADQLYENIFEGVKKHNGDVAKYLEIGGTIELQKYGHELANSEEVKNGLLNAMADKQAELAAQNGLQIRPVPITDEHGNTQLVPYGEQRSKFFKGEVPTLTYTGAYEEPQGVGDPRGYFSKIKAPDGTNGVVPAQEIMNYYLSHAKGEGMNDNDMQRWAYNKTMRYINQVKSGDVSPYKFNTPSPIDQKLKDLHVHEAENQILLQNARINTIVSKNINQGQDPVAQYWSGSNGIKTTQKADANAFASIFGIPKDEKAVGAPPVDIGTVITPISVPADQEATMEAFGQRYDKKDGLYSGKLPTNVVYSGVNLQPTISNINQYPYKIGKIEGTQIITGSDGKQKHFLRATMYMSPNDLTHVGLTQSAALVFNRENAASQGHTTDIKDSKGTHWRGVPVLIPNDFNNNSPAMRYYATRLAKTHKQISNYANAAADKSLTGAERYLGGSVNEPVTSDGGDEDIDEQDTE